MRAPAAAVLVLSSLLAAGCMPAVPERADALSALSGQRRNADLKRLRVALLLTENTKNAAAYLQKAAGTAVGKWGGTNDLAFFESLNGVLEKTFASIVPVDSLAQAKAEGAHAAALLDVYAKIGSVSFAKTSVDIGAAFQSLDGSVISVVRAGAWQRVPYPNTGSRWGEASGAALQRFAVALSTNAELAAYASRAAPPALAAAAPSAGPAAAPPARAYRSDVEAPAFRLPADPSKFALLLGVERYAALPAAEHAVRDAKALKAHLLAAGYPERNIILLTDQQAGKSGLEKYLDAWLPRNTDERSSVFFYFSGHGAPNPDDQQAYLVPWDGDPKFLENTGYPVKRLYQRLNALKAKRVLVAMDACFSGTGGRSVLAKGTRPLVSKVDAGSGTAGRVQALTAAASDEITGTDEESAHGLFTYHLLKGLAARGGKATFKQLHDYLSPRVRDAARRDNRDQTPQLVGSGDAGL